MTSLQLTVSALVLLVLLAAYLTWTAGRLDRLHARVDAAWSALDAQLVRRASAARALGPLLPPGTAALRLDAAAHDALEGGQEGREAVENELSRAVHAILPLLPPEADLSELRTAATRVALARSFHNAAVKNTLALRWRRLPRLLRLAGRRPLPTYFEIDDTALAG